MVVTIEMTAYKASFQLKETFRKLGVDLYAEHKM